MKKFTKLFIILSLVLGLQLYGKATNMPSRILSASEDSLITIVEQTKRIIEDNIFFVSPEEIASCGLSCYQRGEIRYAKEFFILSKDAHLRANDSLDAGKMLSNIAVIYELEGDYERAIETHHQALEIFTQANNMEAMAKSLNNLGVVFQEMNDAGSALKYYNEALTIKTRLQDSSDIASSYNNIGVLWEENFHNPDSALNYYYKSLEIYQELNDIKKQARLLSNISAIYVELNEFPRAIEMLNEGKRKALDVNDKITLNNILRNSAFAYLKSGNLSKSEELINEGLAMSIELDYLKNRIEFLALLADLQEANADFQACVATQKDLQHLKDSLLNKEKNEAISKQEVLFDTRRKEHQIEMAKQALMFSTFELQRQKDLTLLSVIGTLLITLIVLLLVLRYRQKQKIQRIALENKMLRSQMNPHFMFNAIGAIQNFILENNSEESMVYLLDFSRLMRNILDSSRAEEISIEKEIRILKDYLSLQKLRLQNRFDFSIRTDDNIDTESTQIPPMLLQPFLENAVEHGMRKLPENKTGHINLDIQKKENKICLCVSDNGPGFANDSETDKKHVSHAMKITRERIKAINHLKKYRISLNMVKKDDGDGIVIKFEIESRK